MFHAPTAVIYIGSETEKERQRRVREGGTQDMRERSEAGRGRKRVKTTDR